MQCDGAKTFWGQNLPEGCTEAVRKLLGEENEVPTCVQDILAGAAAKAVNARQCMDQMRGGFGEGIELQFPEELEEATPALPNAYGDGSLKHLAAANWSFGGYGLWWPGQVVDEAFWESQPEMQVAFVEQNEHGVGQWNCLRGQMGSSTRMELASWLLALTRRAAVHMGTDSMAMMSKAKRLMDAAEQRCSIKEEDWWKLPNPFKKPWGLQPDGDLWKMAWMAVLSRGPGRQMLTKVKGHATESHVVEGKVRAEDKDGNDWADTYAERGAKQQEGITYGDAKFDAKFVLAGWLHKRHGRYVKFMSMVQKSMAAVIKAEQDERERRKKVQDMLAGHDCTKEGRFTCSLPTVGPEEGYKKMEVLPHTKGNHRYGGKLQQYCEAVHAFLAHRKWKEVDEDVQIAGTTWLEMFVLFDRMGYRTQADRVHRDTKAQARAERRRVARCKLRRTCLPRASLQTEVRQFKKVARYIIDNDVCPEQQGWHKMEKRQRLRRLMSCGVLGHHPAVRTWCWMNEAERW